MARIEIFTQTVGFPIGTNCKPLSVDLFLNLSNNFFVCIYVVLSLIDNNGKQCLHLIYPANVVVKDTPYCPTPPSYLYLEHVIIGTLTIKLYDKGDDFNFSDVNYPFVDSSNPSSAYIVYMSHLI